MDSYNLLDEPWVPTMTRDGQPGATGLIGLFKQAQNLAPLETGFGPTDFTITRLLLAIMYGALEIEDRDDWQDAFEDGLDTEAITSYLEEHRERFDLLGPTPFFQVADLTAQNGDVKPLNKFVMHAPGDDALYSTRTSQDLSTMDFDDAARWLVTTMGYDIAGIHTGAIGDERAKNGRGPGIGVGWAGAIGGTLVEGNTLHETLMLNFVAPEMSDNGWEGDKPVWEYPPLTSAESDIKVTGPAILFTWPARRIRLFHDGGKVTGCLVCQGDRAVVQNMHPFETMTRFRRSDAQEKKLSLPLVYMPRTLSVDTPLWRGVASFMPLGVDRGKAEAQKYLPSIGAQWLARLRSRGALSRDFPVRLRTIGMVYGQQNAIVDAHLDERLDVALATLTSAEPMVKAVVEDSARLAEDCVRHLRGLAKDLRQAVSAVSDDGTQAAQREASARAYGRIEPAFRAWLAQVNESNAIDERSRWVQILSGLIGQCAAEQMDAAPDAAIAGRFVDGKHRNAARAETWFRSRLNKTLTLDKDMNA